jgi:transposase
MMKALSITNDHGWTPNDLRQYEKTVQKAKMRQRVMTIRLVMEHYTGKEVSHLLNLHRETVSIYVKTFNQYGMDGLLTRGYSTGKPAYLTQEEKGELRHMILESTPEKEGFGINVNWDTRVIQHVINEKFSVTMSRSGIYRMLTGMGLSYTRPTYTLAKADRNEQKQFLQDMEMVKKTSQTI